MRQHRRKRQSRVRKRLVEMKGNRTGWMRREAGEEDGREGVRAATFARSLGCRVSVMLVNQAGSEICDSYL